MDKQLESREFTEAYRSALEQAARVTKENGKDVSLAQDAVQETIVRLLLRKKKEKIRNWLGFLSTSVRRTVIKLIKRDEAALRPAVTPSCSDLNSADAIFSRILVNELESQLPERDLEIVRLSEFEGLDWKEIAHAQEHQPGGSQEALLPEYKDDPKGVAESDGRRKGRSRKMTQVLEEIMPRGALKREIKKQSPNTRRFGCPSPSVLREMAADSQAHTKLFYHVLLCGACVEDFERYQKRLTQPRSRLLRDLLLAAAGMLLTLGIWWCLLKSTDDISAREDKSEATSH